MGKVVRNIEVEVDEKGQKHYKVNYIIAKKGKFALSDTRKGYRIVARLGGEERLVLDITEGWLLFDGERIGRRIIIQCQKGNVNIEELVNIERDIMWREAFIFWGGVLPVVDNLVLQLIRKGYKIEKVVKK